MSDAVASTLSANRSTSPRPHPPGWAALLRILVLAALVLSTTGCRLDLVTRVDLDGDGGGRLAVSLRLDAALSAAAVQAGVDPLTRLVERVEALQGWDVERVEDPDGGQLVELSTAFADPAELATRWEEVRAGLAAPEATLAGPLAVGVDPEAGELSVEGELPLVVHEPAASDLGTTVEELTAALSEVVSSQLVVHAPGPLLGGGEGAAVAPADPDDPDGPVVLTWTAQPGQALAVSAVVEQPGLDLGALLLQGGVVVAALALIGLGIIAQRRR